jgi:hypothetical protein
MPRKCTVCGHSKRAAIDKAVISGESNRRIAAQFQVSETSLRRHRAHIRKAIVQAITTGAITEGRTAYELFDTMMAEAERKYRGASLVNEIGWFREWRGMLEQGFKLGMEAQRQKQVYQDVTPAVLKMIEEAMG